MNNSEIFTKVMELLLFVVGSIITAYVIPWIKSKMTENQYSTLTRFIELAVRSAEQLYTPEEWATKKSYVYNQTKAWLADNIRIEISDKQLDTMIEGLVQQVKKG